MCIFPWKGKTPMVTMVWVVGRNWFKAHPGTSDSPLISPSFSSGQRNRVYWASQPQKVGYTSPPAIMSTSCEIPCITRLASNEIFSPPNKIHREVGQAKDLSAPRYIVLQLFVPNVVRTPSNYDLSLKLLRHKDSLDNKHVAETNFYQTM